MNQQTIENMKRYGGGFASRLAELWQVADAQNRAKLEAAFGDVFDRHGSAARRARESYSSGDQAHTKSIF